MAYYDFGTLRIFAGEDLVDVSAPRGDAIVGLLKKLGGRWNPDRRCWRVLPSRARLSSGDIVSLIESHLLSTAPEKWRAALPRLSKLSCATTRYELKIGAGGMRLGLPPGHKVSWALRKVQDFTEESDRTGDRWLIPARAHAVPEVRMAVSSAVREDHELLLDAFQTVRRRRLSGLLALAEGEDKGIGIEPGGIVFADRSFIRVVDPSRDGLPILEMPFLVVSVDRAKDGKAAQLDYPDPERAYALLRSRNAMPSDARSPCLNLTHVSGDWKRGSSPSPKSGRAGGSG